MAPAAASTSSGRRCSSGCCWGRSRSHPARPTPENQAHPVRPRAAVACPPRTVARPPRTVARPPRTVARPPEMAASRPGTAASTPEATAPRPEMAGSRPETVTRLPETTAPRPGEAGPRPETAAPGPPEATTARVRPAAAMVRPCLAKGPGLGLGPACYPAPATPMTAPAGAPARRTRNCGAGRRSRLRTTSHGRVRSAARRRSGVPSSPCPGARWPAGGTSRAS